MVETRPALCVTYGRIGEETTRVTRYCFFHTERDSTVKVLDQLLPWACELIHSNSRRPSYRSLSQNQLLTDTLLLALTDKLNFTRMSMQRNEVLRPEAMAENPESDDSDSDVIDPQYCMPFLYIRCTTDLI